MEPLGENFGTLDALLTEERRFLPSTDFAQQAVAADPAVYGEADRDFEQFWEDAAREVDWFKPWEKTLEWDVPWVKWFVGGELNVTYNCVDRHHADTANGCRRFEANRPPMGCARGHWPSPFRRVWAAALLGSNPRPFEGHKVGAFFFAPALAVRES